MPLIERIFEASAQKAKIDRLELTEMTPIAELHIDSLAFMDLVMQIEEAEGVILTDVEIEQVLAATTLGEFTAIIDTAKANADAKREFLA